MPSFVVQGFLEVGQKFVWVVVGSAQVSLGYNKSKHNQTFLKVHRAHQNPLIGGTEIENRIFLFFRVVPGHRV